MNTVESRKTVAALYELTAVGMHPAVSLVLREAAGMGSRMTKSSRRVHDVLFVF
jgi:hypothetical protein